MKNELKLLGLTNNEIKTYLSLLNIGETSVGAIIDDLKIHRQIVYNSLGSLEEKNMVVSSKKNKVRYFKINNPEVILEEVQKKEMIAKRLSKSIKEKMKTKKNKSEINIFDRRKKIQKYLLERTKKIPSGSTIYVISNYAKRFENIIDESFSYKQYNRLLIEKNIRVQILAGTSMKKEFSKIIADLEKGNKKIRKIKYISDEYISPVAMEIFNGGVSLISFEEDSFIIEIKNEQIVKSYLTYFKNLWEKARK